MSYNNIQIASVIISTYNQPQYLELTLKSILAQVGIEFSNIEIIVADDGSSDETKILIDTIRNKLPCSIKHVWHEDRGFRKSTILNKAVSCSVGEYLIFVDGDCVVPRDYIKNQLLIAENGYFVAGNRVLLSQEYSVNIVKNQIEVNYNSNITWMSLYFKKHSNKLLHFLRFPTTCGWRKLRKSNWKYPKGCNMAVWRKDYYKVNGYDELFNGWGHEDADFFVRLLHSGIFIKDGRFCVPVFHLWHKFNSRDNEAENMRKLLERIGNVDLVDAVDGVNKYESM